MTQRNLRILICETGTFGNKQRMSIEYTGTLGPRLAVEAAKKAFGHANGVTVRDMHSGTTYRCRNDRAHKVK